MQRIWSVKLYLHSFFLKKKKGCKTRSCPCSGSESCGWHTCQLVALCFVGVQTVSFLASGEPDFQERTLRNIIFLEDPLLCPTTSAEKEKKKEQNRKSFEASVAASVKDEETKRCSESGGSFSSPASPFQFLEMTTLTEARRAGLESDRFDIGCLSHGAWKTRLPPTAGSHQWNTRGRSHGDSEQSRLGCRRIEHPVNFVCLLRIFVLW